MVSYSGYIRVFDYQSGDFLGYLKSFPSFFSFYGGLTQVSTVRCAYQSTLKGQTSR
jgi:hypothetical protein